MKSNLERAIENRDTSYNVLKDMSDNCVYKQPGGDASFEFQKQPLLRDGLRFDKKTGVLGRHYDEFHNPKQNYMVLSYFVAKETQSPLFEVSERLAKELQEEYKFTDGKSDSMEQLKIFIARIINDQRRATVSPVKCCINVHQVFKTKEKATEYYHKVKKATDAVTMSPVPVGGLVFIPPPPTPTEYDGQMNAFMKNVYDSTQRAQDRLLGKVKEVRESQYEYIDDEDKRKEAISKDTVLQSMSAMTANNGKLEEEE